MMTANEPVPVNTSVDLNYSAEQVKQAIEYLIRRYPAYFVAQKKAINHELGTYVFSRPKGIDTPTLRLTVRPIDTAKASVDINCSASSFTVTPPDLQLAITEVQNIIMAKLHNVSNGELDYIIKQNNSGNGLWGCFKSISCLGVFILILFVFGIGLLSVLL